MSNQFQINKTIPFGKLTVVENVTSNDYVIITRKINDTPLYADYKIKPENLASSNWNEKLITIDTASSVINSDFFKGEIGYIMYLNGAPIDWIANGVIQVLDGITNQPTGDVDFSAIGEISGRLIFNYRNLP